MKLDKRQYIIYQLITDGYKQVDIAEALNVESPTINQELKKMVNEGILTKIGVKYEATEVIIERKKNLLIIEV